MSIDTDHRRVFECLLDYEDDDRTETLVIYWLPDCEAPDMYIAEWTGRCESSIEQKRVREALERRIQMGRDTVKLKATADGGVYRLPSTWLADGPVYVFSTDRMVSLAVDRWDDWQGGD